MSSRENKIPPIIKLTAFMVSFIAFGVGFWHTHLGLKEMRPFESDYGSLAVAIIILLMLLLSYFFAIRGKRIALTFWIICASSFVVFNLNFFYPSYLGRQLVKEEAIALNDTLQTFSNRVKLINNTDVSVVSELHKLQKQIFDEVNRQAGFGSRAKDYLRQFNAITGGNLKPDIRLGNTQEERNQIANAYYNLLENEIKHYVVKRMASGKAGDAEKLYAGTVKLDSVNIIYTPILKEIIADDSSILLEMVKTHSQINQLQRLVTDLDDATIQINEASHTKIFPKLGEAKARNLGRIAHTLSSIVERIGHIDTWAMILLCLFNDFLVPFGVYMLIRRVDVAVSISDKEREQKPIVI